jgi:cyclophilin family peptidyl-prolyl cis-trans isomerase
MKLNLILVGVLCLTIVFLAAACSSGAATTTTASKPAASLSPSVTLSSVPPKTSTPVQTTAALQTTTPASTTAAPAPTVTTTVSAKQWSQPPSMQIDTSKKYTAAFETSLGSFKVELYAQESPKTVNNFVFLSQEGFYNGIIFHRIIKEFMIQTGDPKGNGSGGPGYKFADELPTKRKYEPGIVAMANAGPNTNGSQFFICTGASSNNLNQMPNYTQFGKVIEGMDVVMKIASVTVVTSASNELSKPVTPPVIKGITITES